MKVSGFTFCRNAVKYDYPVVESITSALPLCDEFVVNVGRCDDGTLELIQSIHDPRIKIVESVWDESLRKDGLIYSHQTNIALSHCKGDWAFYIQADEVVHEDDLPVRHVLHRHISAAINASNGGKAVASSAPRWRPSGRPPGDPHPQFLLCRLCRRRGRRRL